MKCSVLTIFLLTLLVSCNDKKNTPAKTENASEGASSNLPATEVSHELSFTCTLKDKQIEQILKAEGKNMTAEEREALESELAEIVVEGKLDDVNGGDVSIEGPVAVGHEINNEGKNKIDSVKLYRKVRANEDKFEFMVFDTKAPGEENVWQRNYYKLSIGKNSIVDFKNFKANWESTFESANVKRFLAYLTIWSGERDATNELVEELPKMLCDVTARSEK